MAIIGKRNQLTVLKSAPPGFYLDGGPLGELLLPGALVPEGAKVGDVLDVFLYRDSEDRLVTTTETPHAQVGEFAYLRVVSVAPRIGVFLDWGLSKDLLLPIREIKQESIQQGDWVIVYVMLDTKTDRIVASMRLKRHLSTELPAYKEGQEVNLLVTGESPMGYNAIVENAHHGLLYRSDLSSELGTGLRVDGFVRAVREDGKIDLSLDRAGHQRIEPNMDVVMTALKKAGGRMPFQDDSSPEEIRAAFGLSKKAFKQAIGSLFKDRRIVITQHGIRLVDSAKPKTGN
ncbi:MAG: S1-like domain-containing RNA-binding protein [Rariglobus sp.]